MDDTGIFLTFEGGDGAGKTTQTELLVEWLKSVAQREVVRTFEPGATAVGRQIRELLLHGDNLAPRAEALLFAADRAQHVANVVRPALERGAVVVCDRYIDSSVAYQGGGRELASSEVRDLSCWATQNLLPDLVVILDIDPRAALERRGGAPDRMERESLNFHDAVREEFLRHARSEPQRYLIVDAQDAATEIHAQITARLQPLLGVET